MIPFLNRAVNFSKRTALISNGKSFTYQDLIDQSDMVASNLLNSKKDLKEARVAFIVPPSFEYTAIQWGIWKAGGIAVPLCVLHPLPSLRYVLEDTQSETLIIHPDYWELLEPIFKELALDFIPLTNILKPFRKAILPDIDLSRRAMILYTSGTTSKPKGVVTTHANIEAQITTLFDAWDWSEEDHILNILPLHHVHGIINVMSCALWSGGCCEFLPKFDAEKVWDIFRSGRLDLFMAVPTIYFKLISFWENSNKSDQLEMSNACQGFRLMVSGSAALPVSVLEKWKDISGLTLLERYGMTEIGMGLSNPYRGERRPGHVGLPLPGVEMRIVDGENELVPEGTAGEIQIKGKSVFLEYWQKEEATKNAFTENGWFKTGDIALLSNSYYRILGRDSVDIIKSGGYKISALEIEEVLRTHPEIKECGVVGLPNEEWGEIVGASLILYSKDIDYKELTNWLKERLPAYKIPRQYIIQNNLPRNTLGKVTKNELKKLF
ncbi:MAG: acyl-CoA synthetase [Bacteroidetes bacterium]|jgi:malonyl-CoA/methylmalonyl-CoA synthetase|nr:acyl-CoA synthetase [Bacteroidota bacterium]MDF1864941.1 acyl-CoA synthetase [Saprospiraceae bacterium]